MLKYSLVDQIRWADSLYFIYLLLLSISKIPASSQCSFCHNHRECYRHLLWISLRSPKNVFSFEDRPNVTSIPCTFELF
jgi:hypothetical protein